MTTLLGKADVGATEGGNLDSSVYCRFQCSASGTIDKIYFRLGQGGGTFLRLAIYSDNAGAVDDVLAQGAVTTRTANSWVSVTGLSVEVTKDTYYWLAARLDGYYLYDAGRRAYVPFTGNNAFTNDPGSLSYDNNASLSIYADGISPVSIDIAGVTMTAAAAHQVPAVVGGTDATTLAALATGSATAAVPIITGDATIAGILATASAAAPVPAIVILEENEAPSSIADAIACVPTIDFDWLIPTALSSAAAEAPAPLLSLTSAMECSLPYADALALAPDISGEAIIDATLATADAAPPAPLPEVFAIPDVLTAVSELPTPAVTGDAIITGVSTMSATTSGAAPVVAGSADIPGKTVVADAIIPVPQVYTTSASAEVTLVGERLAVVHDPAITSSTIAGYVAIAILVKARLDGKKAQVTIPPLCGLELWDVLSAFDDITAHDGNLRVSGYTFEMDTRQGFYRHIIDLCAP